MSSSDESILLRVVESVEALTEATELLNAELMQIEALSTATHEVYGMLAETVSTEPSSSSSE
jgi:hypothetical protein|tara:strand:- start:3165 stop:3350 length:186 start_codon:yes stop_codon:yes gene_type:complete